MSDNNISILIRTRIDKSNEHIKSLEQQIKSLSNQIKTAITVKLNIDPKDIQLITQKIKDAQNKVQKSGNKNNNNLIIGNVSDIENKIKRVNNALDRLKVNKDKVFSDTRVTSEVNRLKSLENQFRKGLISAKDYSLQMDNLRTKVAQVSGEFKNVNKDGYTFTEMLSLGAKKVLIWGVATNLVYGSFNQFKQGISYLAELDNSLNEIRIVTNKTQQEVNNLAQSYNELAKEMSVTTREIASTSADLYRQGLNDSQVEERMKSIIQYAKISSISLEDSNKIITATANATGESVQKIIDIFALLGDTTASDASEIGEALQRVASASEIAGLSIEKTSSWLSTISSITRESSSTIGRSLNSVIARYESIKKTGFNSDDPTKLNDVVKALSDVGIQALDSQGQLKEFAVVMDELGAKFNDLSKNEKSYIATTLFG